MKNSTPGITKGIARSSKHKQKLYEKFLKNRTLGNEMNYKTYRMLFEFVKRKSKIVFYSKQMKEVIGKDWKTKLILPRKIIVNNIEINEEKRIASKFNNFFIDIAPELASVILGPARFFETYLPKSNTTISIAPSSVNELKNPSFSIKTNKCPGHDEINFNVIRGCLDNFDSFCNICLTCFSKRIYIRRN